MKKEYNIVALPSKLEGEVASMNERFRILYFEGYVEIELFDIQKNIKILLDENEEIISTVVTYKKRTFDNAIEIVDGIDINKKVEVWLDYDFDEAKIDLILSKHSIIPHKTDNEKIWDSLQYLLGVTPR